MARSISTIFQEIVKEKVKRLELNEIDSDSKVSVFNGIAYIVAAAIYSFEVLMDVFTVDIGNAIGTRVNGTPQYFISALLKFQYGDELRVREDGLGFGYEVIDESKRIVTQAAFQEDSQEGSLDQRLILKVAKGDAGNLSRLDPDELQAVRSYIDLLRFAGMQVDVVSRKGDILVPRLTVFHDGSLPEETIIEHVMSAVNGFMISTSFRSALFVSRLLKCIQDVDRVTDVFIDQDAVPAQGVFIAQFDSADVMQPLTRVNRVINTASGYLRESSKSGEEKDLPDFRQSMVFKVEAK